MEKQKLIQAELLLVEQQKLLLKEKQKLLEASQGSDICDQEIQDLTDKMQSAVYEDPTENEIKCLIDGPKSASEKKKD